MDDHHIRKSYISLQEKFVLINKYIGKTEVWRISEPTLKNKIIYINFEMIRIIALLLISFIPKISDGVLKALKIPEIERNHKNLEFRKFQKGENENLLKNFHYENNESCFLKVDFQDKHFFFRKKIDKI